MENNNPGRSNQPSLQTLLEVIGEPHCFLVLQAIADADRVPIDDIQLRNESGGHNSFELDQEHLSVLEEKGYIRRDKDTRVISQGPNFSEVEPYLNNWEFLNHQ